MRPSPRPRGIRRAVLTTLALTALASPALASGCAGGFESIDRVTGLRVLGVTADKPYAAPGDAVTFKMSYADGLPRAADAGARALQILWIGGCFDPPGDEYYGCFAQIGALFASLQNLEPGQLPPPEVLENLALGDTYTLKLPGDIISRRPKPALGPHYGIAYVFFAACAGTIKPIPPESTGKAGSFPFACFDAAGERLGADSFVPGYTQVYSFADGRTNDNPVVTALTLDDKPILEGKPDPVKIERCKVNDEERDLPPSCTRAEPYSVCTSYKLGVNVPADVGELDPESKSETGKTLREVIWVDYFTDRGSFDNGVALVSSAEEGVAKDRTTRWLPSKEPGPANLWAVVRDARGGATVVHRTVTIE
jgi:hypothetical protein